MPDTATCRQRYISHIWSTKGQLSIFTVSRQDVYDYLKCSKIVAFKTHMSLREGPLAPRRAGGLRHETGVIGEITARHMLAGTALGREPLGLEDGMSGGHDVQEDHAQRMTLMKRDLGKYRIALDETIGSIFKETVKGLEIIKRRINNQYGEINVIGRGESRNGLLSSTSRPDFVAVVGDRKKLVMVEVKNAKTAGAKPDKFQATFYNTVGAKFGITVMEEYGELSSLKIAPMATRQKISETMLVYPRRGEFEVIKGRVDISRKIAQGIWVAKQLGMKGKAPETDCDSGCPHHRLKRRLPEGNIDVAIPLPLVYSKGRTEQDVDLDAVYWDHFLRKKKIAGVLGYFRTDCIWEKTRIDKIKDPVVRKAELDRLSKARLDFVKTVSRKTGLATKWLSNRASGHYNAGLDKSIEREMADEIKAWRKTLGARRFERSKYGAKGQGTRIYALPKNSARFVEKSWNEWD